MPSFGQSGKMKSASEHLIAIRNRFSRKSRSLADVIYNDLQQLPPPPTCDTPCWGSSDQLAGMRKQDVSSLHSESSVASTWLTTASTTTAGSSTFLTESEGFATESEVASLGIPMAHNSNATSRCSRVPRRKWFTSRSSETTASWSNSADCGVCGSLLGKRRFNPRHHCRACNISVCAACSPNFVKLGGGESLQRVCNPCAAAGPDRFASTSTHPLACRHEAKSILKQTEGKRNQASRKTSSRVSFVSRSKTPLDHNELVAKLEAIKRARDAEDLACELHNSKVGVPRQPKQPFSPDELDELGVKLGAIKRRRDAEELAERNSLLKKCSSTQALSDFQRDVFVAMDMFEPASENFDSLFSEVLGNEICSAPKLTCQEVTLPVEQELVEEAFKRVMQSPERWLEDHLSNEVADIVACGLSCSALCMF